MIRRDFLKLCTAAVAVAAAPPLVVVGEKAERGFEDAHLEIVLLSTEGVALARGETRQEDGAESVIEFNSIDFTGEIAEVLVSDLKSGRNVCTLRASGPGGGGAIICNTTRVSVGDTVHISGLLL